MFTQFLHPELVLFGQFSNGTIKCKHEHEIKDSEIIVHQVINRASLFEKSLIHSFTKMMESMGRQKQQYGQQPQDQYDNFDRFQAGRYENQDDYQDQNDYDDDIDEGRDIEGYFEQDPNPYAEQVYGLNMDAQYMPQQLNGIGQPSPKKQKKNHSEELPYILAKKMNTKKEAEKEDDQGWVTEEEQQYYVNQQLQQAGGNFATQFDTNSLQ